MCVTEKCSSPSLIPVLESRRSTSVTSSIRTGKPSVPSGWVPASVSLSQKASSSHTEDGSGWKASREKERSSTSRCRCSPRVHASSRHLRRNLQHIADTQFGQEPDQPPALFIGGLVDAAQSLNLIVVGCARDRESDLWLFRKKDCSLVPPPVFKSIAEKPGVDATNRAIAVDRPFRQRRRTGRGSSRIELPSHQLTEH